MVVNSSASATYLDYFIMIYLCPFQEIYDLKCKYCIKMLLRSLLMLSYNHIISTATAISLIVSLILIINWYRLYRVI